MSKKRKNLRVEDSKSFDAPVTVFLEISVVVPDEGAQVIGRVEFELFGPRFPRSTENFRGLCTGEFGKNRDNVELTFRGCSFHRVSSGFWLCGGDITTHDGKGGCSVFSTPFFRNESPTLPVEPYCLAYSCSRPNCNGSQFFVPVRACPWLDGDSMVFGRVSEGSGVIDLILDEFGSESGNIENCSRVFVSDCGEVTDEEGGEES